MLFKLVIVTLLSQTVLSGFYTKKSGVVELTVDDFDQKINSNSGISVVEFYAPWCGHCQQLKPEYIKAAKELAGVIPVYAVDLAEGMTNSQFFEFS